MAPINLFDLYAKVSLDTSEYDSGIKDVANSGSGLASKLKSGLATAGQAAAKGIGVITTAAGAAVGGLLALEASTEGYRIAQGKLNTAFEAAGYSADTAKEAYNSFYGILGDTDRATEASQLLAKLAESEEDVATWADIAAGVAGTFGDSLPIESLIEAGNETAKVGTVTGTLADALNWAGINEDEFNAKLAECTDESDRNRLIMETLSDTYDDASDAFYRNNEELVKSRENQAKLDEVLANFGETVSNAKNSIISEFLPSIANIGTALAGMLSGVEGSEEAFSTAISGFVQTAMNRLPEFLNFGIQIISSLSTGILQSLPTIAAAVPQIIMQLVTTIMELAPQIIETGGQIIMQLANGIITYVPQLVAQLPVIITEFINFITSQLPQIMQNGTELLNQFVSGILAAIPQMVSSLPQLITAYVNYITTALPEIIQSGISLLKNFIEGIIKTIPELVASLPEIISAIVNGIGALMGSIIDIGKNIVQGVWQGIKNMVSWFTSKVKSFFSGIVDSVLGFLGINSPSKVFAGIGGSMVEGLEKGWDDNYDSFRKDVEQGMNFETGSVSVAASATGRMNSTLSNLAASLNQNATIVVNSVLDGKIIGRSVTKYQRNAERAHA